MELSSQQRVQDRVKVSAVICSDISPIRKMITEALSMSMLMFVNRPIVKKVYA
jgi:hypothetical protein